METQVKQMPVTNKLLFVYGLLRNGQSLHRPPLFRNGCYRFKGVHKIKGFDMFTNGGYPMIKRGNGTITGEVYMVDDDMTNLDRIECAYDRETITIDLDGKAVEVEIYIYKYSTVGLTKVEGGDFLKWKKK